MPLEPTQTLEDYRIGFVLGSVVAYSATGQEPSLARGPESDPELVQSSDGQPVVSSFLAQAAKDASSGRVVVDSKSDRGIVRMIPMAWGYSSELKLVLDLVRSA